MAYTILEITKEISSKLNSNWMSSNDSSWIIIKTYFYKIIEWSGIQERLVIYSNRSSK